MAYLILVRHGITDWNAQGRWQGLTDIPLNEEGRRQARETALMLPKIKIDSVYTSLLCRTKQTYDEICSSLRLKCPVTSHQALNERDYGIYTGKNKWEVEKELGHEQFIALRRSWNYPIPGGEALKDVHTRVVRFYNKQILKDLKNGENVLVISSGNTLRALIKYLENISNEDIAKLELTFGEVYIYEFDRNGKILSKQTKNSGLYADVRKK